MLKIGNILRRSGKNTPVSKTHTESPRYEICVCCGVNTDIPIQLPVYCRKNYIDGCGQLCEKCASALEQNEPTPLREITSEMLTFSLQENAKENRE